MSDIVPRDPLACVCNPTTRECVALPTTIISDLNFSSQFRHSRVRSIRQDIQNLDGVEGECGCSKYEIFTLGGQSWRIIGDGPEDPTGTKGICLNGTIYWAEATTVAQNSSPIMKNRMIVFDVGEEKFRSVPTLPAASLWETHNSNIIQLGKQIAIVDYSEVFERISSIVMIWKLEDSETGVWSEKRFLLPQNWVRYFLEILPFLVASVEDGEITLIPRSFDTI